MSVPKRKSECDWPHCDPRILHEPGKCVACDEFPDLQHHRKAWQICFTGETPQPLADPAWSTRGAVLPCPADYIRGDAHAHWIGNQATQEAIAPELHNCDDCGQPGAILIDTANGKYGCINGELCLEYIANQCDRVSCRNQRVEGDIHCKFHQIIKPAKIEPQMVFGIDFTANEAIPNGDMYVKVNGKTAAKIVGLAIEEPDPEC